MSNRTGRRVQYAALPPATQDTSLQIKLLGDAMRHQSAEAMRLVREAGRDTLQSCTIKPKPGHWSDVDSLRRDIRKQIDEVPSYQNPKTPPTGNNP